MEFWTPAYESISKNISPPARTAAWLSIPPARPFKSTANPNPFLSRKMSANVSTPPCSNASVETPKRFEFFNPKFPPIPECVTLYGVEYLLAIQAPQPAALSRTNGFNDSDHRHRQRRWRLPRAQRRHSRRGSVRNPGTRLASGRHQRRF